MLIRAWQVWSTWIIHEAKMYILLLEVEKPLFSFSYFVTDPLTFFFLFFKEYSRRCLEMHLFRVIIQCWLNLSTCQLSNHKSNTLLFGKVYSDARLHYHMTGVWRGRAMIMSALEGKWLLNVQYSLKRGGGSLFLTTLSVFVLFLSFHGHPMFRVY